MHLLAARRLRARGLPVPEGLLHEEREAALLSLGILPALELVRASCDGVIIVLKGPELAARYPEPYLRPATDVDLLVSEPQHVQRRLLAAGFVAIGLRDEYYEPLHHLRPLWHPGLGIKLEIHRRPAWVGWSPPPPLRELFAAARPSSVGVDGICTLTAAEHALLVAAHSWSTLPLRRLLDLVDVFLLAREATASRTDELALRWDLAGVWRTMNEAADALLRDAPEPLALRTWARDLVAVREPTVLATHLRRLVGPSWALPPRRAAPATLAAVARELRPGPAESWNAKRRRSAMAVRHALRRRSEHDRTLQ